MKALVLEEYNKLVYKEVSDPKPSDEDVLIAVKAAAICGSDVHGMDGSTGRRRPPVIMGHEASGIIIGKGPKVKNYSVGDRVTFDSTIYCGSCEYCRNGRVNLCSNRKVLGVSCDEYRQNGAFAEFVVVPEKILYKIPESVSFEHAAMTEPVSIALHALNRTAYSLNDTAVVTGAGMIGLLLIRLLSYAGFSKIIAVDIDENKLDMALKFGAHKSIMSDRNVVSNVLNELDGKGADSVFEVVGFDKTFNIALDCTAKGGNLTLVGNLTPTVTFPLQKAITKELNINTSCASSGEYADCLDIISRGIIDLDVFISACPRLEDGATWFDRLYQGEKGLMKVILKP